MKNLATNDEELRKLLVEIRLMEGSANILQSRLNIISAALGETIIATNALEGVKVRSKGTEMLVPVGAGSFLRAELSDVERVITGVGAGVCIEKNVESSIADLKERRAELEKSSESLQRQLSQLLVSIDNSKSRLSQLIQQRTGQPSGTS